MESGKVLVYFDSSNKLQLHADGLNVLKSIPDDFGIIPLAAVGPGRIGKSSLLNQLIGKDSFGVGSTTSRVTKGVWIDKTLDHHKKLATVYVDVEGFGDPRRTNVASSDNHLLLVICQICDVVMYNTKGVYDSELIEKLILVCQLFKRYRRQNQLLSVPILVTILRDFDLDIPDSPDNDLRELLKKNGGATAMDGFRCIKAFTFVKPTEGRKLRELQHMSDAELDPEYVSVRKQLLAFFSGEAKPLCTQRDSRMTGKVLVEVLHKTVKAVNDDEMDRMTQTLTELLQQQNEKLKEEASKKYESQILSEWPVSSAPEPIHKLFQESTIDELKQKLFDIDGTNTFILLQQFRTQTNQLFETISEKKSRTELERLNAAIEQKYKNSSYFRIGGTVDFYSDMHKLERRYKELNNLGPKANDIWQCYQRNQESRKQIIKGREDLLIEEQKATKQLELAKVERETARQKREEVERERRRIILEAEMNERRRNAELLNVGLELTQLAFGLVLRLL